MKVFWIIFAVVAALVLIFLLVCHLIGKMFLRNIKRKNPGEKFDADFDVSFYRNSPVKKMAEDGAEKMKKMPKEEIFIKSFDGIKLHGTYYPSPTEEHKVVIGIHGFQSNPESEFGPFIEFYHSIGFSMLLVDDRAHGLSEGPYITMGVKDRLDCVEWAKFCVERFSKNVQILLHGVSMGGATVLSASAEDELPEQVIGVVSDCGYTSVEDSLRYQLKNIYHAPTGFPLAVCRFYAKHKAKFDFEEGKPIDAVRKSKVPILFVQGFDDKIVPCEMAYKLYDECTSRKKMFVVPTANHAESIAIETDMYHDTVREFFNI